ncbi:TlpA family protein disulfide reductase [Rudanella lutea]|uniref:TlpA family protein disulfide reductase n=1 Tax=Rudanella lutea TaxID=451374 RepID=UPI0003700212|nr:redoxin domain-containing protein [Rudanella lutea]
MKSSIFRTVWSIGILWALTQAVAQAQQPGEPFSFSTRRMLDESTRIIDQETGKRVSLRDAMRVVDAQPRSHHLEPVFDEYGQASSYKLRPLTVEEKQTGAVNTRDPSRRPKVGDIIPLFVMKDVNNKSYRSTDLHGQVVVLTFLLDLNEPFWNANQAKSIDNLINPSRASVNPLVLGVVNTSKAKVREVLKTAPLPFIPIPDAVGFHQKFSIMGFPSYIVIDRTGKVAAVIEPGEGEQLKEILSKLN